MSLPIVTITSVEINEGIVTSQFRTWITLQRQIPFFRKLLEHCSSF